MATRGVFQLRRLRLHYCEHGGSSRTLRDYIASGRLARWAEEHPHGAYSARHAERLRGPARAGMRSLIANVDGSVPLLL